MNNREFALKDNNFRKACEEVKVIPTKRQASKWRSKKGKAYRRLGVFS